MFKNGAKGEGVTIRTPLPRHTHRAARDTRGGQNLSNMGLKSHSLREPRSKVKRGNDFPPKKHSSVKEPDREAKPSSSCPPPLVFSWGMRTWRWGRVPRRQDKAKNTSLRGRPVQVSRPFTAQGAWPKGLPTGCPALFAKPGALALAVSAQRDRLFLIQIKTPFQASGGAISCLPPNEAALQAPPRPGAGRGALAETQHGLEAAPTQTPGLPDHWPLPRYLPSKPKPVDTTRHRAPQAHGTRQGRHVGWTPSCLPEGSITLLYACRPHSCTLRILSKFLHKGLLAGRGQGREWGQLCPT